MDGVSWLVFAGEDDSKESLSFWVDDKLTLLGIKGEVNLKWKRVMKFWLKGRRWRNNYFDRCMLISWRGKEDGFDMMTKFDFESWESLAFGKYEGETGWELKW